MSTINQPMSPSGPAAELALIPPVRSLYTGPVGIEYKYCYNPSDVDWIQKQFERAMRLSAADAVRAKEIHRQLVESEALEQFLQLKYPDKHRFSLEGGETLIPLMHSIVRRAVERGSRELIIGMA